MTDALDPAPPNAPVLQNEAASPQNRASPESSAPAMNPAPAPPIDPLPSLPVNPTLTDITKRFLLIDLAETRGADQPATHEVTTAQILAAFEAIYTAGLKAGIAKELGIQHVVHSPGLDRFPWQVHSANDRCDLFAENFSNHTRIRSSYYPDDDRPHAVPLDQLPMELLDAVRAAQGKDRSR